MVTCTSFSTDTGYCNNSFSGIGICEDLLGYVSGCTITGTVNEPPAPAPPTLYSPPPAQLQADATAQPSFGDYRYGVYCAPGSACARVRIDARSSRGALAGCPKTCLSINDPNPDKCRYGGMVAFDLSVYSFFYAFTEPDGLVSGKSLLACRMTTAPNYCPSNISVPSYCEPQQGTVLGCYIVPGTNIQAPNPPPPPPPTPPTPGQCSTVNNFVSLKTSAEYVTGKFFSVGALGSDYLATGASTSYPACNRALTPGIVNYPPCTYGGLQCADSTVYSMYYEWSPPSDAISGQSMVSCYLLPNAAFCPGKNLSSPQPYSFCEPVYGSTVGCVCTSGCATKKKNTGTIIGATLGSLAGASLLGGGAYYFYKRRHNAGDNGAYSAIGDDNNPTRRNMLDRVANGLE